MVWWDPCPVLQDPFDDEDCVARAVGCHHNHTGTPAYIAHVFSQVMS
jgi:hypothetical protein